MATLSPPQRALLTAFEASPEWEQINTPDMLAQVHRLLDRYSMPEGTMARFLMELEQRLLSALKLADHEQTVAGEDEYHDTSECALAVEIAMVRYELIAMAAILTRKERGKPVLL